MIFPRLSEETVFVACPSDLQLLRARIETVVYSMAAEAGSRIVPYSWKHEIDLEGGFHQRLSMQKQIPPPSDILCKGLICVLSERIGTPLEDDFPADLSSWRREPYPLMHPWPHRTKEQAAALKKGAFPLTGTTWEFLDGHAAEGKPVFVAFIADRPIDPKDDSIRHGHNRLLQEMAGQLPGPEYLRWAGTTYDPQIRALRNFAGALSRFNLELKTFETEDSLIGAIRAFLFRKVLPRPNEERDPFRGLRYYDIDDGGVFYGRGALTDDAVRKIERLAEGNLTNRFVGFVGPSGCGKSSVMRAGALFELKRPAKNRRYQVMAVRPTDFHDEQGTPRDIPKRLHALFVEATGLSTDPRKAAQLTLASDAGAAELLVGLICDALPQAEDGSKSKLVIGLDQLEEIVDDLRSNEPARGWQPLLAFIEHAVASRRILFVYTLESSRQAVLAETPLARFLLIRDRYPMSNGPEFRHEIVNRPFDVMGFQLGADVEETLYANFESLTVGKTEPQIASLLPLVALTLQKIYDKGVAERMKERERRRGPMTGVAARFEIERRMLDPADLDIGTAIATEAEAAFKEVAALEGHETDIQRARTINFLLRPLIRLDDDTVTLRMSVIPRSPIDATLADAFIRRRLLISDGNGRIRLVHEALLRHWKPAEEWLRGASEELRIENEIRRRAEAWERKGRPRRVAGSTDAEINQAAQLLDNYLRLWTADIALPAEDQLLRDYCLALLAKSKTPTAITPSSLYGTAHVHVAAFYGAQNILEVFRKRDPACLDQRRGDGWTPLACAAWTFPECVAYLLKCRVDPCAEDEKGWPPIVWSIMSGRQAAFDVLLPLYTRDALLEGSKRWSILGVAASKNRVSMVERLVRERGLPVDQCDIVGAPLHHAARRGGLEMVRYLLPLTPADLPNPVGRTALHIAAANGHFAVVRELLTRCDPNAKEMASSHVTALHLACGNQNLPVVNELLAIPRTDPNILDSRARTPLSLVIDQQLQRRLLGDPRIDPLLRVKPNEPSPLAMAIDDKLWEIVRQMLDRIDGQEIPQEFETLHHAIRKRAPIDVIERLIAVARPAINAAAKSGVTPLMAAASVGAIDTMRLLVERGADPLVVTEHGTALHAAMISGDVAAADWLTAHGGPKLLQKRDAWGRRPADLASKAGERDGSWNGGLSWKPLGYEEIGGTLGEIDGRYTVSAATDISAAPLPFYPKEAVRLVRLHDPSWGDTPHVYFLQQLSAGKLHRLDGRSSPIHTVNAAAPVALRSRNVADYLRFFCFFVRAEEGPFLIVESAAQEELRGWSEEERRTLQAHLRPVKSWRGKNDVFRLSATVLYATTVFFVDFVVNPTGMVEMADDDPLAELAGRVYAPISLHDLPWSLRQR